MSDSHAAAETRKFRILSLDGGGIKGAFTASALASLELNTKRRAVEHFDLITGTSTGGILAIGLGLGFSAAELLQFYVDRGPVIFPSTGVGTRFGWVRQLFGPKHSHSTLRRELAEVMGDRLFGDSQCRLAIPAYDSINGRIYIMKTAHLSHAGPDTGAAAVDVALATSAAPTYFQAAPFPIRPGARYVDGGVWANCPAMVGVAEAIHFCGQKPNDIDVLSIGTTFEPFNIYRQQNAGAARWNVGIIQLMFEAQVEAARAQAKLIAGGFHRIDAGAVQGEFALDRADAATIGRLVERGNAEATKQENFNVVKARFLDGLMAPPYQRMQ